MEEAEYNEVIATIKMYIKTVIGWTMIIGSGIILYTMLYHAEWWINLSEFVLAMSVIATLLSLSVGIIIICERLNSN